MYEQEKENLLSVITSLQKEKNLLVAELQAAREELLKSKNNHASVLESLDNQISKMVSKARAKREKEKLHRRLADAKKKVKSF